MHLHTRTWHARTVSAKWNRSLPPLPPLLLTTRAFPLGAGAVKAKLTGGLAVSVPCTRSSMLCRRVKSRWPASSLKLINAALRTQQLPFMMMVQGPRNKAHLAIGGFAIWCLVSSMHATTLPEEKVLTLLKII